MVSRSEWIGGNEPIGSAVGISWNARTKGVAPIDLRLTNGGAKPRLTSDGEAVTPTHHI
jgi:hypothetical protein